MAIFRRVSYVSSTECPRGFEDVRGFCFMMGTVKKSHEEATASCQNLGGFLAEPRSEAINTAVKSFNFSSDYWIGIIYHAARKCHDPRKCYCWQTDKAALEYTNWDTFQPTHHDTIPQCGMITRVKKNKHLKKWKLMDCPLKYAYLCQSKKSEFFQAIFLSC